MFKIDIMSLKFVLNIDIKTEIIFLNLLCGAF
jgi:hypothetical protein